MRDVPGNWLPMGHEQIVDPAVSTALVSPQGTLWDPLAANTTPKANMALIFVSVQNARFLDDGTAPTAAIGGRLLKDSDMSYAGDLKALRFIREAAGAIIDVLYYRT